MALSVDEK
jgi:hypothetical protein